MDCWEHVNDGQLGENESCFYIEEQLDQEFYIGDVDTRSLTTLFHEMNFGNVEGILVDKIEVWGSRKPLKYIIGVKQKGNNWQGFFNLNQSNQIKIKIISH